MGKRDGSCEDYSEKPIVKFLFEDLKKKNQNQILLMLLYNDFSFSLEINEVNSL